MAVSMRRCLSAASRSCVRVSRSTPLAGRGSVLVAQPASLPIEGGFAHARATSSIGGVHARDATRRCTLSSAAGDAIESGETLPQPPPLMQPPQPPTDRVQQEILKQPVAVSAVAHSSAPFQANAGEFRENYHRFLDGRPFTSSSLVRSVAAEEEIFANADLPLAHINAYGFDFDYTLASYNANVSIAIFKYGQEYLVERMGYPAEILAHKFDPSFAIRGLHFDTRTGYILKLDQNGKVQTSTVYKGRQQVAAADIVSAYRGVSITKDYRTRYLRQMTDLFALSETNLLADIIQTFMDKKLDHSTDYIYRDVRRAIEHVHTSGILHNGITANPGTFLDPNPQLGEYLLRLRDAGKMTFLLTNSPFGFVDAGMQYMLASIASAPGAKKYGITDSTHWLQLFDVVITSARKPAFFTREGKFRRVDPTTGRLSWQPVTEFRRGEVYTEGSLAEFTKLTTRNANNAYQGHVVYMGDHVGADLTAPWQTARWRTVAIVRELAHEIQVQSTPEFQTRLRRLLRLESLIDYGQRLDDDETLRALATLKSDRDQIKQELLTMFNSSFGSVFRTSLHRTEFFQSVGRYADIYTSNVNNFLRYSLEHCFYAKRPYWPHEVPQMETDEAGECKLI